MPLATPTAQEILDALDTAVKARLDGGAVGSYSIGGRNIQYMPLDQLMRMRDKYKAEVAATQDRRSYVEFEDPS